MLFYRFLARNPGKFIYFCSMSYFKVNILGCGSATPTLRHMPSCQAIQYRERLFLVDCGEGAQLQMRRFGLSFAKITDIFISHLHGDHCLGLPGLLSTMSLHGVEGTVTVHTFAEGADIFDRIMKMFCHEPTFKIAYNIIDPANPGVVYQDRNLRVTAFRLFHRVPCVGYKFEELPKRRHIDGPAAAFYQVPHYMMDAIKDGEDFMRPDGAVVPNDRLTKDPSPARSYAYCSDTMYDTRVADAVRGTDVIYHEATYGDANGYKAAGRGHSTAREAGRIAAAAGAETLVIGHYSKAEIDPAILAAQATEEFSGEVIAANEGLVIDII